MNSYEEKVIETYSQSKECFCLVFTKINSVIVQISQQKTFGIGERMSTSTKNE